MTKEETLRDNMSGFIQSFHADEALFFHWSWNFLLPYIHVLIYGRRQARKVFW